MVLAVLLSIPTESGCTQFKKKRPPSCSGVLIGRRARFPLSRLSRVCQPDSLVRTSVRKFVLHLMEILSMVQIVSTTQSLFSKSDRMAVLANKAKSQRSAIILGHLPSILPEV